MLSWVSSASYFRVVVLDEQTGTLQLPVRLRRHELHLAALYDRAVKDGVLNGVGAQGVENNEDRFFTRFIHR